MHEDLLYFVRGGHIDRSLYYAGSNGYYWSRVSGSITSAYALGFSSSSANPLRNDNRLNGFSLRCVAIGS